MRTLLVPASFLLLVATGCRAPAIPADPTVLEYAVWRDVLAFEAEPAHPQAVVISPETIQLDERELQFQRCLPQHMRDVFDDAPAATLSMNVPEDWLRLSSGQQATLSRDESSTGTGVTLFLRLSRVAFSRFRRDGYVWAERRSCTTSGGAMSCDEREGKLLHVVQDGGRWTAEETNCGATAIGEGS